MFKKPIILCIIHYLFWCILAFVSNINSYFKSSPIIFEDLFLLNEASNIFSKYINKTIILNFTIMLLCIILLSIILFKIFFNLNIEIIVFKNKIIKFFSSICFFLLFLIIKNNLFYFGESFTYSVSDFDITTTYNKNGFFYSFYKSTYLYFSNNDISNYDINKIFKIKNVLDQNNNYENTNPKTNIILIQLESIFDPLKLNNVTLSKDPLENYRNLLKNNIGGELIVPVIGGGTTQTEFEILTGISFKNFYTKMPYLNLLNYTSIESIAHIFKKYNYATTSTHNYFSTFYNRVKAYENLGFDTFIPLESISDRSRGENFWYKDTLLIDEIKNKIISTPEKDFIFGVTVESHGPYNTKINENIIVESSVLTEKERLELQNYVNIIKYVDEFIINLIDSLNSTNEEYVLIFYSDHLPSLGENHSTFNKTLPKEELFKTPYIIINSDKSNFTNLNNKTLYSYEFLSEILKSMNLNTTIYQKFRDKFKNYKDFEEYEKQILLDIKYKNIYNNNEFPYESKKIKIGNNPPIIKDIKIENNDTYILGDYFTPNNKIYINKKEKESEYISKNVIKITNYIPEKENIFISITFSNKNTPLNVSNFFEFLN